MVSKSIEKMVEKITKEMGNGNKKEFMEMIEKSRSIKSGFYDGKKFKPKRLADKIKEELNLKTIMENDEILFYNGGVYHPEGEKKVLEVCEDIMGEDITLQDKREVIGHIKHSSYIQTEEINKNKNLIWLKNGIYDLENDRMIDFNPELISTIEIPVKYDPKADCPKIKKFIEEVVGEDQIKVIQECLGYCLTKDYGFHKAFMFFGSGKNGKSTLLKLIEGFLGEENISYVSLQDLCYNRFSRIELFGKLANIHADIPARELKDTGDFKMLTGEDVVRGEKKHKDPIKFKNFAKLIFSANTYPNTNDVTYAFFRRWILIKFDRIFEGKEDDKSLPESIMTEKEMSGLFNWALEGLRRLKKQNKFSSTETTEDVKKEWIMRTDPLIAFIEKFVEYDSKGFIAKDDFMKVLNHWCQENELSTYTPQKVGQEFLSIMTRAGKKRISIDGKQIRVWSGVRFKDTDELRQISKVLELLHTYKSIFTALNKVKSTDSCLLQHTDSNTNFTPLSSKEMDFGQCSYCGEARELTHKDREGHFLCSSCYKEESNL